MPMDLIRATELEVPVINRLSSHPEVMVIDNLSNHKETFGMTHYANTQELAVVRGQLEMVLDDRVLPAYFNSFLVNFDEEGILTDCWGVITTVIWPDSIGFKLL
jgi:hypothetical protein